MFKLIAFFAILAAAFAAPKPEPDSLTYSSDGDADIEISPLEYSSFGPPISYSNLEYGYIPSYASGYHYGAPLAYQTLYV